MKQDHPGYPIITGGSSGIGFAIAERLVGFGWNLSLIARTLPRLDEVRQALERLRVRDDQVVHAVAADVSNETQANNAIDDALARLGTPGLLITCAGMAHPGYFWERAESS
uniref:3-dehydrosphinganine reductase n=1 Tax=Candidatus Kentrum sp. FW TaxID=2126338 RepID=A0A450TK87_9GAMM|nr:MAG: 3-dehydrosphinganine reductase [Candidatus Kentron sp. FW]VFJ67896.1 MAG: 3-dehydrosphinganine reductase [Candidatus Kentron sp. FW]